VRCGPGRQVETGGPSLSFLRMRTSSRLVAWPSDGGASYPLPLSRLSTNAARGHVSSAWIPIFDHLENHLLEMHSWRNAKKRAIGLLSGRSIELPGHA
jgi:hypothetical protein